MTARLIGTTLLLLSGAAGVSPAYAQRSHFGPHVAYNFDMKETAIGAQLHLPIAHALELYPSFDYYLVDSGSLLGLSADLKFRTPGDPLYLGGGLNVLRAGGGGSSSNDTGFDLFAGLETRYGWSHPYVEIRGLFHSGSSLQGALGINITLH
jgi:hypothetical protein